MPSSSAKDFQILVYSDGACSGNPGPGGWGAIVATPDGHVEELGGGTTSTTNNRMELQACIAALLYLRDTRGRVDFYTDSTYVIRGITQWVWSWRRNGWKNGEGQDVMNQDLWTNLFSLASVRKDNDKIHWHYSRGHAGTPGNERCDEIAVAFSKNEYCRLYSGSLLQYPVALYDVPADTSLPEMKPKTDKVAAHSYLSLVGGEVWRHKDWASCDRRTKGVSGAKFKKALNANDEQAILKAWGLSPDTPIKSS